MNPPAPMLKYVIDGIAATPTILSTLLNGHSDWDARPDPERFTMREMVAHLADWDPIWIERIKRTIAEDNPFLASVDESLLCEERSYRDSVPSRTIERLVNSRADLVDLLRSVPEDAWNRPAHREFVGDVTLLMLVAMIHGHDAYHLKQAASGSS